MEPTSEQLLKDLADQIDELVMAHRDEVKQFAQGGDIHSATARILGHDDMIVEIMQIIEERLWRLEDLSK